MEDAAGDADLSGIVAKVVQLARDLPLESPAEAVSRATSLADPLGCAVEALVPKEQAKAIEGWKAWLTDKADRGWRRAHAYTKLPDAWKPEETHDQHGVLTGDPVALFGKACSKLAGLWNATDCSTFEDECNNLTRADLGHDTIEKLSGPVLGSAARSFSPSTSATYDGIHPRQLDCLSDETLDTLAAFLNFVEDPGA